MRDGIDQIVLHQQEKYLKTVALVEASLFGLERFDATSDYTPKELEPYDALSDRFIRSVEVALKYFRSVELREYAINSDTIRDLLGKMEKLGLVSSVELWLKMRDVRNRIVHDYLPKQQKQMFDQVMDEFAPELLRLKNKIEMKM